MKKVFLLSVLFFLTVFSKAFCQEKIKMNATNSPVTTHPLVMVDGFETDMESMVLSPNNIDSINIFNDKEAIEKYGERAKDGAIIITTKPGTEFKKIEDFLDLSKNNKAKIGLNGKIISNASHLLIDKSASIHTSITHDPGPYIFNTVYMTIFNIAADFSDRKE